MGLKKSQLKRRQTKYYRPISRKKKKAPLSTTAPMESTITPKDVLQHYEMIRLLASIKDPKSRADVMKSADPQVVRCIESIARNINSGALLAQPTPEIVQLIQKHKGCLDKLASSHTSLRAKKQLLARKQTGGFLGLLLRALPAIGAAITSLFTTK